MLWVFAYRTAAVKRSRGTRNGGGPAIPGSIWNSPGTTDTLSATIMSKQARSYFQRPQPYRRRTQRPLNCLLWLLPMLLVFHLGSLWWRTDLLAWRDIHWVLRFFGAAAPYLPPAVLVIVLLIQHGARRDPWEFDALTLAGMMIESCLAIVPLIAIDHLTARLPLQAASAPASSLAQQIVAGVGAGVYEEFVFRMVLIGLAFLLFVDLLDLDRHVVGTVAILLSAAAFSLYHFSRQQIGGTVPFPWSDFVHHALAGAYLGAVYVTRGLGIAAGAHAFYNVFVSLTAG